MMRPPVSLSRLRFTPGSHEVVYARKGGHDEPELTEDERIDAMDFVARVLVQIPDPRRHSVRYYGFYSNAARGKRKKVAATAESSSPLEAPERAATPQGTDRAALRRGWAEMSLPMPRSLWPAPLEIRPFLSTHAARKGSGAA